MGSIRKSKLGFTLVEMVIVMLVLGIMTSAVAPKYFEALDRYRVEAVARKIIADLKFAQREAQRTSSLRGVKFDVAQNSYLMIGVNDIDRQAQAYSFDLANSDYQVKLHDATFGGSSAIVFDIYGRPSAMGGVVVTCGGEAEGVVVEANGVIELSNVDLDWVTD